MLSHRVLPLCLLAGAGLAVTALPAEEKKPAVEPSAVSIEMGKDTIEFRHGKNVTAIYQGFSNTVS